MFGEPYEVIVEQEAGGHGGGDPRLLDDLFGEKKKIRGIGQQLT